MKDFITLNDINVATKTCLDKINIFEEVCSKSSRIEETFSELSAEIEKYKELTTAYNLQDVPFIELENKDEPSSYPGKENPEAEDNTKLKKICAERAIDAIYTIRNCDACTEKDEKIKQLYWFLYYLRFELQFKLYALSTLDSYLPYSLGFRLNRKVKQFQKQSIRSIKKDNWKYLGYARTFDEAYHYAESNGFSWGGIRHLCAEPEDECTNDFVKIESIFFTEYFDCYAKGPLGQVFKFRKRETTCLFCKKKFTYEGYSCNPIIDRWNDIYFQDARCCKRCYRKYVKPAKKDKIFAQKIRTEFKLDIE